MLRRVAVLDDGELLDRFRLVCRVAYETTKAGATIGQFESEATRRLGCSKEDIRPFLRCCWAAARQVVQGVAREPRSSEASLEGVLSPDFCGTPAIASAIADMSNADYQYERGSLAHHENEWEEAESWYTRAAEQGHAKAQFDLGMMYFNREIEGLGVGECVEHAVSYCTDAARAGVDCAKAFLERDIQTGLEAYRRGDDDEAELEFRRLAELDNAETADAQFKLAQMCIRGESIDTYTNDRSRFDQACEWLRRAARNGCGRAESSLCGLLGGHGGWFVEEPGSEDRAEQVDWYWKAAERTPPEQYDLGLRSEGDPDHACSEEASFWYRLAADRENVDAQFRLGLLAYLGLDGWDSVERPAPVFDPAAPEFEDEDEVARLYWLGNAARNGHQMAHALLEAHRESTFGAQGAQTSLFDVTEPSSSPKVAFPDFVAELQSNSKECKRDPCLLAGLYRTNRQAAEKAGVSWAGDFSTDAEIKAWYAGHAGRSKDEDGDDMDRY